jgi:hypothetical protein
LPRKPEGKEALVRRINERHQRRSNPVSAPRQNHSRHSQQRVTSVTLSN